MTVTGRAKHSRVSASTAYAEDFVRWCFDQAELLKAHDFSTADLANIVQELESMGNEGDSATLREQAQVLVAEAYRGAVLQVSDQTDLARRALLAECPYTLEQLRAPDWMPH